MPHFLKIRTQILGTGNDFNESLNLLFLKQAQNNSVCYKS